MTKRTAPAILVLVLAIASCTGNTAKPASSGTRAPDLAASPTTRSSEATGTPTAQTAPSPTGATPASPEASASEPPPQSTLSPAPVQSPTPGPPQPTAVGSPTGPVTSQAIGPSGGTASSADGVLSVVIPPGALSNGTAIGIQPISSTAPGALPHAFRLTPAGQTFAQPITLTFHFSNDDLAGTLAEQLAIAYQDEDGTWNEYDQVALDAGAQTISVTTDHFTDEGEVAKAWLAPRNATVALGKTQTFQLNVCLRARN